MHHTSLLSAADPNVAVVFLFSIIFGFLLANTQGQFFLVLRRQSSLLVLGTETVFRTQLEWRIQDVAIFEINHIPDQAL